ncbi:MAG: AzlC family ABC transporter permease [Saccharofermentans sp.]|nr:AzlC family ABC transporter permease [Saccharofermentans sp.]
MSKLTWHKGFNDGLAIGLGYLSVSFSFGIMAANDGLAWWQAVLISLTNLTSAGQVAGVGIMAAHGTIFEMALTQFIINLRYSLMGISLSQKTDESMTTSRRLFTSFFITDEIFGVASSQIKVGFRYMTGLGVLPVIGWTLGTLLGAVLGSILPAIVTNSLAIGIYGMFVAIVLPVCRKNKIITIVSAISIALSVAFRYTPIINENVSNGFAIIICAVISALIGVFITPSKEEVNG